MKNRKITLLVSFILILSTFISVFLSSCGNVSDSSETSEADTYNETTATFTASSDPYDLYQYLLYSSSDIERNTGEEFQKNSDTYECDYFSFREIDYDSDYDGVNDSHGITEIWLTAESDYNVCGFYVGMSDAQAEELCEKLGNFKKNPNDYYREDFSAGISISVVRSAIADTIESVRLSFNNYDVADYFLDGSSFALDEESELLDAETGLYRCSMFDYCLSDYGSITKMIFTLSEPHIGIYDIRCGMTKEQAVAAAERNDFYLQEDHYIQDYYNNQLYIIYDESGRYVERVEFLKGYVADLSIYFSMDSVRVCDDYGCVETEENYFYGDGVRFHANESLDYIDEAKITDKTKYNIYGVEYGMNVDEALALLAEQGFDAQVNILCEHNTYSEGYALLDSQDGKTVSSKTVGWKKK